MKKIHYSTLMSVQNQIKLILLRYSNLYFPFGGHRLMGFMFKEFIIQLAVYN